MKQLKNQLKGFTLIELMIVIAVVAILAAIAYPNYTRYVQRGYRSNAQQVLLESSASSPYNRDAARPLE